MLLLLLSGLGAAVTLSVLSDIHAGQALQQATWDQLVAIRETNKGCLQRYVDQLLRQFRIFSGQDQLPAALDAFREGFAGHGAALKPEEEQKLVEFYKRDVLPSAMDRWGMPAW